MARNVSNKYKKQLLDTVLDSLKIAPKKVTPKAAEAIGEFIGKKITDKIVKPTQVIDENRRNVAEITIRPEKREKILNKLRQVL